MKTLLEIKNIRAGYESINVLWDLSLTINEGETTVIVGPNGAGKTTLLRVIMGLMKPTQGEILFNGERVNQMPTWDRIDQGWVMIPEGRMLFPDMSVEENLTMGAYPKKSRANMAHNMERVFEMFPRLKERRTQQADSLSGGEAQMLAIGRGLMEEPKVCFIDEPSLGLSPVVTDEIFQIFEQLKAEGLTIILVEQNTNRALKLADQVYLMQSGSVSFSKRANEVDLQELQDRYFARV